MRSIVLSVASAALLLGSSTVVLAQDHDAMASADYVRGTVTESFGTPPEPIEGQGSNRLLMLAEREIVWNDDRLPSRMAVRTIMDTREGWHPEGTVWPTVSTSSYRLEDANGAWVGTGYGFGASPEEMPSDSFGLMEAEWVTLTGEGAYEGLSAVLVLAVDVTDWMAGEYPVEGYIYEGAPPPVPDPLEPGFTLPD